jgi:hypothetical protein
MELTNAPFNDRRCGDCSLCCKLQPMLQIAACKNNGKRIRGKVFCAEAQWWLPNIRLPPQRMPTVGVQMANRAGYRKLEAPGPGALHHRSYAGLHIDPQQRYNLSDDCYSSLG